MNPLLRALEALGGSGSVEEIYDKVVELEALSDEVLSHLHDPENCTNTEVWYRLAWARTYLKKFGLRPRLEGGWLPVAGPAARRAAGVDAAHVYHDCASGVRDERPGRDGPP